MRLRARTRIGCTLGFALALVVLSLLGPRPADERLVPLTTGDDRPDALTFPSGNCLLFERPPNRAPRLWMYAECSPLQAFADRWTTEVALAPGAARDHHLLIDDRSARCNDARDRCELDGEPGKAVGVRAVDARGRDVASPVIVAWNQRHGPNLRPIDLARAVATLFLAVVVALVTRGRRARTWLSRGPTPATLSAGVIAGALLALRPVAYGGATDLDALVALVAAHAIATWTLWWASVRSRHGAVLVSLVVCAATLVALTLALTSDGHVGVVRTGQESLIASAVILGALAGDERPIVTTLFVAALFGGASLTLDLLSGAQMPYPAMVGAYRPWELMTSCIGWIAIAPIVSRFATTPSPPARWTRHVAGALAMVAADQRSRFAEARAHLLAFLDRHARRPPPIPDLATEGYVHALREALVRLETGRAVSWVTPRVVRATLLLTTVDAHRPARGVLQLSYEPRATLFPGERVLTVIDGDRPAGPSLTSAVHVAVAAFEARLGRSQPARVTVSFAHEGVALEGRSFELSLALAYCGMRDGRAPFAPDVVATGRLAGDRDTLLPIDDLVIKASALAPGETLIAPLVNATDVPAVRASSPDIAVLTSEREHLARHRCGRHADRDGRTLVLVPTLASALRVARRSGTRRRPTPPRLTPGLP